MKNIVLTLCIGLLVISSNVFGQDQNLDLVKVQVVASGKTETEAITEALRSALTQTSSVFISSNTTLINDELAKDQISMINNGSVAEYKIIDKATKDDGTIFLTCNVIVSVNKLGSFVESSGGATELKGGLFASNIKLMELNERAEEKSIQDLLNISREMLNSAFDYEIINGEPKNKNGKWQIPLIIQIKKNLNYIVFANFFYSTLKNIKLPDNEVESYIRLNKPIYSIGLFDNSKITTSTPILNTERVLPKQNNFQYYTRLYDNYDQYPNIKPGGYIRYDNYNDISQFLRERAKLLKKVYNAPEALKEPYRIHEEIFTSTQETIYDNIVLRSRKSYDSLSNFVLGFSKFIQNAEINNGLNSINLSEIGFFSNNYRRLHKREDYSLGEENNIYLPIAFYNFEGRWVKFLSDFRNLEDWNTLGMPNLEKSGSMKSSLQIGSQHQLQYSMDYGKNSTWEDKMLVLVMDIKGHFEWMSYKQYSLNSNTDFSDATYPYFNFVFASYAKYFYDFQILKSKSSELEGFPLQLTLVGNHQNVVFKIEVNNIVTLDEISKIQKYTIRKIK